MDFACQFTSQTACTPSFRTKLAFLDKKIFLAALQVDDAETSTDYSTIPAFAVFLLFMEILMFSGYHKKNYTVYWSLL